MTVSKEILMHPDFTADLADELCGMLEALIDAEFEKGDDTDFDFIDECADAINAIRSGSNTQILPLISRKDFLKKIGVKTEHRFSLIVAACAAAAVIFILASQIEVEENVSVVRALSGIVSDLFADKKPVELITAETTAAVTAAAETSAATTAASSAEASETQKTLVNISVETTPDFKTEYYVGEKFSDKGLRVFGEYDNGERLLVRINGYTVEAADDFGAEAGYETVKITSGGFTETVEVRIIEKTETKKLTSIYAVFPDDFDFTADDLHSIGLTGMQVYAVYSDGSEKELSAGEYTVETETEKHLFKENALVTIGYGDCSCSFAVYER